VAENGVIDPRTGELRDGGPEDKITMHTPIIFDPTATCVRWERFLEEIFNGDTALVDFVWRSVGYSLTGLTKEQILFILWGSGANGKSVFLKVLRRVLGEYALDSPFTTFDVSARSGIPNDVAALAGRRLVTASESNENMRLSEAPRP
jgi:putative DNA primase/helicase